MSRHLLSTWVQKEWFLLHVAANPALCSTEGSVELL